MIYQWLLFDADGTLFDYDAAEHQALRRALQLFDLHYDLDVLEAYREINEQMWKEFELGNVTAEDIKSERFARLFAALDRSPDPDPQVFGERYLTCLGDCVDLMPDAEQVLSELEPLAHLALITNGLTAVQRSRLAKSGLGSYFEAVVISDEEGVAKPDPAIFDIAMERMGHPPKDAVLMIGDSLTSDMRGADLYDIDACWYNPDGRPRVPDVNVRYEIRSLQELLQIVSQSP